MIGLAVRFFGLLGQDPHGQGGSQQDIGEVWTEHMMHEVSDSEHWLVPFLNLEVELPHWPPLQIGSLTIDFSPTKHVIALLIAATLTAIVMIWTARQTHGKKAATAPKGLANLIEAFVIYLRDEVCIRSIGQGAERYVSFLLTLFFFVLFANLLGLVPFGSTATANIGVTGALAIVSLVAIEVFGLIEMGPRKYIKTIIFVPKGVPWWLLPLMVVIMSLVEFLSKLTRIFALAIRLFANMTAGHFIILSLIGLIFLAGASGSAIKYFIWPAPIAMAVAVMLLEIFVAFLQAYIFTMLTSVFIGLVRHAH